jgi:hypothetical protein
MAVGIQTYLDEIRAHLHLDPPMEKRIMNELSSHFQEKVGELEREGLRRAEAEREAMDSFGEARAIARLMYEAYSRGSWVDAFLSSQPHFIVAALFATHFWHSPFMLGAAFAAITLIAILGRRGGSPTWTHSWLGYAFFPLLISAFLLRHPIAETIRFSFGGSGSPAPIWELAVLAALYGAILWLVVSVAVQVGKRDWLFVSLMLLPLPVLGIWAFTVEQTGDSLFRLFGAATSSFGLWDSAMACFSMVLGVTSALFVRLRQRLLKAGAVIVIGIMSGALVVRAMWAEMGFLRFVAVSLCLFLVFISPFILHAFFSHEVTQKQT